MATSKKVQSKPKTGERKQQEQSEASKPVEDRQRAFIDEYLKDRHATNAAIRAGYSQKTARSTAARLLSKANIRAELNERLQQVSEVVTEQTGISLASVVQKLHDLAFFDIRTIMTADGTLMPPSEWPDTTAAAIAGIEVFEEFSGVGANRELIGHTKKVKLIERTKSLDMLMKHLGGYEKDNAQGAEALGRELRTLGDSERAVRLARMLGSNPEALVAVLKQAAAKVGK